MSKMEQSNDLNEEIEDVFEEESNLVERPEKRDNPEEICEECIYGYDIFSGPQLRLLVMKIYRFLRLIS